MKNVPKFNLFRSYKDQPLRSKMGIILSMFCLMAVANYFIVNTYKKSQRQDADVVNLAGRQRTLSQQIGFFSGEVIRGHDHKRKKLQETITLADKSLQVLNRGGLFPGIRGEKLIPPAPATIVERLSDTETLWKEYKRNAEIIVKEPLRVDSISYQLTMDSSGNYVKKVIGTKQVYNPRVNLAMSKLEDQANTMLNSFNDVVSSYVLHSDQKKATMGNLLFGLMLLNIIVALVAFYVINKYICRPITRMRDTIEHLSVGELENHNFKIEGKDEIGLAVNDLSNLNNNLLSAADFAGKIGNRDFNTAFEKASDGDSLGEALIRMRDQLLTVSEEDGKRNWVAEGLAEFNSILRSNQEDLHQLSDDILSYLINYLEANQGAIYLVNSDDKEDAHLELMAMYAWGKKKHIKNRLEIGEGVAGQAWREGMSIYLTEVPQDYVQITSGLGKTNPSSVIVVPLKLNDETYGIMEIASLKTYHSYQVEFIEKLAESIASVVSFSQTSHKTKSLLDQTQRQSEMAKAQEEEMRQTMEEIQATSEEMERKEKEYLQRISDLEAELEGERVPSKEEMTLIHKMQEEEKRASLAVERKQA